MSDDERIHPNLADAIGDASDDAAALDAIARRLGAGPPEEMASPPPDLFARIEAELSRPSATDGAEVVPLRSRQRSRWLAAAGAAAAVALVVIGAVVVLGEEDPGPTRQEVELAALPGFDGTSGSATLTVDGDERSMAVTLADVDVPPGSHLELWLLDADVEQLVSLGEVTGEEPHSLPSDVDLDETPVVDVSLEPDDGDPAHSGVSVVRGELAPA